MKGRKRMMGLVAAGFAATVLLVVFAFTRRVLRQERAPSVSDNLPANVNQQLSGYTFTRSEGGRQIFTVHAARTLAFSQGGATILEDVYAEVFGRTGNHHDALRAERCEYNTQSGGLSCSGTVEIGLNAPSGVLPATDVSPGLPRQLGEAGGSRSGLGAGPKPMYLETSKVSFQPQGSLVTSDEPIRFRLGLASGSAVGIRYAAKEGWLELKKEVVVNLPPRTAGASQTPGVEAGATIKNRGGFRAPLRLSATGLRYQKQNGEVALSGPLEIRGGSMRLVAGQGRIFLDSQNRVTRTVLQGGAHGFDSWPTQLVEADAQTLRGDFDPSSEQLRDLVANGNVQVESRRVPLGAGARDQAASISHLSAQEVQISFMSQHVQPARAHQPTQPAGARASGDVHLSLESTQAVNVTSSHGKSVARSASVERKDLTASEAQFDFRPKEGSLKEVTTVGPSKLVLTSSDPQDAKRIITAGRFLMSFDTRNRLESLRGFYPTQVVFEPPTHTPPEVPKESSADQLTAAMDPATQQLTRLEQAGDFRYRDGDRQATAEQAQYSAQSQLLTLTGQPQLWDPDTRVRAERFLMDLATDTVEGLGKVESAHFERASAAPSLESAGPPPRPGLQPRVADAHQPGTISPSETTNVLADRMLAKPKSQFVHYEGHVRAWHGYDVVESPALDVYRKEGRLSSGSGVVSSHLQPAPVQSGDARSASLASTPNKPQRRTRPLTVRAERLDYRDAERRAAYRGSVRVEMNDASLKADRVDVYFSASPAGSTGGAHAAAKVERVVAEGHVTVAEPTRRASGEHAEYYAAAGKIVMTGGPPTLLDADKGFITSQRLTFFVHDDSLLVDGGAESPTVSKHRLVRR